MGFFSSIKKAARTLHVDSAVAQFDVKKLVKDPGGWAKGVKEGYGKDLGFAKTVYSRFKSGQFKSLATQGAAETVKAFGGSKALQDKAASFGGKVGEYYGQAKAVQQAAAQVQAGDYRGAAATAKGAGGTLGQIGSTVTNAYGTYDQIKGMADATKAGGIGALLNKAKAAGSSTVTTSGGTKVPIKTAAALAKSPLGAAASMVAASKDTGSLARAASPGAKGETQSPVGWAQYKSRKETLGGLL